jgi:hypothetical protein
MFDAFMVKTLPLWFTASALLALIVAVTLVRAAIRIRNLRMLLNDATRRAAEAGDGLVEAHPWQSSDSKDWVAH